MTKVPYNNPKPVKVAKPSARVSILDYENIGKFEPVSVDDLVPYANNARVHTDKQIDIIARSIQAFGFVTPILIDRHNSIIAGHGRVAAAKRLGIAKVPALRVEHLNAAQIKAYRLVDNRHAELSHNDPEILALELQGLEELELGCSIENLGWSMAELDGLFTASEARGEDDGEQEDAPVAGQVAVSRRGDVWLCGRHRVLCGSSLDTADISIILNGKQIDMAIEDAPYNVSVTKHVGGLGKIAHREFVQGSGEMSEVEFQTFLTDHMTAVANASKPGAVIMEFMDWRSIDKLIAAGKAAGLELINLCVWAKTNGGMGSLYRSQHELCAVFKKPGASITNNVELGKHGRYRTNVWTVAGCNSFGASRMEELTSHPTVKPVAMIADAILDVSKRGEVVFDGFLGSGTTLITAERKGRICYGIDLDPLYVDTAVRRWMRETGQQAVLEATGQTFAELEAGRDPVTDVDAPPAVIIRKRTRVAAAADAVAA